MLILPSSLLVLLDGKDSDEVIGETSIESLLILGENEGGATNLGVSSLLGSIFSFDFVFVDELLVWKVIDSDTLVGTNNEPVVLGGENDNVNW